MQGWIRANSDWQAFRQIALHEPAIAICLQTTGADPLLNKITYVMLATSVNTVALDIDALGGSDCLNQLLAPLLTDKQRVKVFHNAKFALRFLLKSGLVLERIFDSMLADQLLAMGEMQYEPDLNQTVSRHLDVDNSVHLSPEFAPVRQVYELRKAIIPKLVQAKLVKCAQVEFECSRVTAEIENAGLRLDAAALRSLVERGSQRMAEAVNSFASAFEVETESLFGNTPSINLSSDAQLLAFLQGRGLPLKRVSARALTPYIQSYPGLQHIIAYRKASNERALTGYLDYIHPRTGRIHPTYTQLAAATGRFGCSNPNIQSFPRTPEHRACIVPAPGRVLVVADYSQIELRIAAQISGDQRMLTALRKGEDLHRLTASILMDKPPAAVEPRERQAAKAVNFGLIYAMGASSLVDYARQQYGVDMTPEQAVRFRDRYFNAYRGVLAWHNHTRRENASIVRTLSGRMRQVQPGNLPTALNSPIQGTGADILKMALVLLSPELRLLGADIVAIVHDEILVESPLSQAEAVCEKVSHSMQKAAHFYLRDVPCPVEASICKNWADS